MWRESWQGRAPGAAGGHTGDAFLHFLTSEKGSQLVQSKNGNTRVTHNLGRNNSRTMAGDRSV